MKPRLVISTFTSSGLSKAIVASDIFHFILLVMLRVTISLLVRKEPFPSGNLLVIAPHPDDEILGVGGIILAALENNKKVYVTYLTDGEGAGVHSDLNQVRIQREKLTDKVMRLLGIPDERLHRLHLIDGAVPCRGEAGYDEVVESVRHLIDQTCPDSVLATHAWDHWPFDHVACAELAEDAVVRSSHKPALYGYWVWTWYNLRPWRLWLFRPPGLMAIDIAPWTKAKQRLVDLYLNPVTPSGKPWSGVLPAALHRAFRFHIEVLEKRIVK